MRAVFREDEILDAVMNTIARAKEEGRELARIYLTEAEWESFTRNIWISYGVRAREGAEFFGVPIFREHKL